MNAQSDSTIRQLDRIPVIGTLLGDTLAMWVGLADAANLVGMRYVLDADAQSQPRTPKTESALAEPHWQDDAEQAAA